MENRGIYSHRRLELLEEIYDYYNDRKFIHPDPLEFVIGGSPEDMEIVALIASSLAYGRVSSILASVKSVLAPMDGNNREYIMNSSVNMIANPLKSFKHRFTTSEEMIAFVCAVKIILEKHGSLYSAFVSCIHPEDIDYVNAMSRFSSLVYLHGGFSSRNSLIPKPELKSACKRLFLFLRWMVRKDAVDPGPWGTLDTSKLIIPLDTHMHSLALKLGLTSGKSSSMKTAAEITSSLKLFSPEDPVKYDFALTRPGIRGESVIENFFDRWKIH